MVHWRRKQGKKRVRKERNEKWSDNREREIHGERGRGRDSGDVNKKKKIKERIP